MIYLINEINFDSDENTNPKYSTCYGYVETESEAKNIVETFNNNESFIDTDKSIRRKYKGYYDDTLYPYLNYAVIEKVKD